MTKEIVIKWLSDTDKKYNESQAGIMYDIIQDELFVDVFDEMNISDIVNIMDSMHAYAQSTLLRDKGAGVELFKKCDRCGGDGYTAEHDIDCDGRCSSGSCPIQVQCEYCAASGFVPYEQDLIDDRWDSTINELSKSTTPSKEMEAKASELEEENKATLEEIIRLQKKQIGYQINVLKEVSPLLDGLINRTPTGLKRNELCDINIKVKTAIEPANPYPRKQQGD